MEDKLIYENKLIFLCYNEDGDNMKKFKLFIILVLMFSFTLVVSAEEEKSKPTVTLEEIVDVINNGEITKEYIKLLKDEVDEKTDKKVWNEIKIRGAVIDGELIVSYSFKGNEIREDTDDYSYDGRQRKETGDIRFAIQEDGVTLKSVIKYKEKDEYLYEMAVEVHNLMPLWEIEATDKFAEIKKYIKDGYIQGINTIIDKCYRQEMHVCRTVINSYGDVEVISDVEMNDEPAKYVLNVLREQEKEANNSRNMVLLMCVAFILAIIMIVLKNIKDPSASN